MLGVDHLIIFFETNRPISCNHSLFACRSSHFFLLPLPPLFSRECLVIDRILASSHSGRLHVLSRLVRYSINVCDEKISEWPGSEPSTLGAVSGDDNRYAKTPLFFIIFPCLFDFGGDRTVLDKIPETFLSCFRLDA